MADTPLRVDIVSDVVCPWCAVGYHQLAAALDRTGAVADIHWHPFELHPDMKQGGENYLDYLGRKYGMTREQCLAARERMTEVGAEVGFTFNYSDDMRTYNSFGAHRLIHRAGERGLAHEAKLALLRAFFTERRAIDETEVLLDVAASVGLDPADAEAALDSDEVARTVRAHEQFWTSRGVTGVPAMVFDEKHLLSGAQGVETYARLIETLRERESA